MTNPKGSDKSNFRSKVAFGVILALVVGYLSFRNHLEGSHPASFDSALRYVAPVLISIALLIEGWERSASPDRKIITVFLYLAVGIIIGIVAGQGKRLNNDDTLGMLACGALLAAFSSCFFYFGSHSIRGKFGTDSTLNAYYYVSIACWIFSFFQIPFWSLLNGHFPPKTMTSIQAMIAMAGVGVSVGGSGLPWIILYRRFLIALQESRRQ